MKRLLLLFIVVSTFSSCRVTKSLTMWEAKDHAKLPQSEFIAGKYTQLEKEGIVLAFGQVSSAEQIWKAERTDLGKIDLGKYELVAPILYKSELDFRKVLTPDQYILHTKSLNASKPIDDYKPFFLSDYQMSEIKRIYKLKYD